MPTDPLHYSGDDFIIKRFFNLAAILTHPNNGYSYQTNLGESLADTMVYHIEKLPQKIYSLITDPRIVTIAISALAILITSYAFYPSLTVLYITTALDMIPFPPAWAIKFAAYLLTVETILGYTVRAESRLFNENLLTKLTGYYA